MTKTITHKDLADSLGVSETTVKSYRRKFPGCIPVANAGKPIRFTESALAVATRIRDLFSTGMSVDEVRLRLSKDFSWIKPEAEKNTRQETAEKISPEISQGVSNMAKSMVTMAQQQKAIVKRMQVIETQLEELGLKGVDVAKLQENRANSTREKEYQLDARLDNLDAVTGTLASTVSILSEKIAVLLNNQTTMNTQGMQNQEQIAGQHKAPSTALTEEKSQTEVAAAKNEQPVVISFQAAQEKNMQNAQATASHEAQSPQNSAITQPTQAPEPQRTFFSLAMVVRTAEGRYMSAGTRGRGRFTLNDLKAMLVYGFQPPNHYTMQFEQHGEGWWLKLEQPHNPDNEPLFMLLMELPTNRGENVIEILQLKRGQSNIHPAEICAVIDSIM